VADPLLVLLFAGATCASLAASWLLVTRLERVGARLGLSEALLGMLAALAADAPEITAAVTALTRNERHVGAGVVIGSNVFNLAALLGLSAVVAGSLVLHRRVLALAGSVALWVAAVCLAVVSGLFAAAFGLALVALVLGPYAVLLGLGPARLARLRVPAAWRAWLATAIHEEELELQDAIHPRRGTGVDAAMALAAVLAVVGASVVMERTGSKFGTRHGIPASVIGGLLLAGVTSLPNAVAAIYLAARGRGAAVLSTALNSNAINVAAGLLLPGAIVGLGAPSGQTIFLGACYLALTLGALAAAYAGRGLARRDGVLIVLAYLCFAVALVASG
jgi:cation:H+ antiporter